MYLKLNEGEVNNCFSINTQAISPKTKRKSIVKHEKKFFHQKRAMGYLIWFSSNILPNVSQAEPWQYDFTNVKLSSFSSNQGRERYNITGDKYSFQVPSLNFNTYKIIACTCYPLLSFFYIIFCTFQWNNSPLVHATRNIDFPLQTGIFHDKANMFAITQNLW